MTQTEIHLIAQLHYGPTHGEGCVLLLTKTEEKVARRLVKVGLVDWVDGDAPGAPSQSGGWIPSIRWARIGPCAVYGRGR